MRSNRKAGQAVVMFILFSVVLIAFVGLGIDLGFAYVTKAQLSKAVDAASLAAISNYSPTNNGDVFARTISQDIFWANYATNGISGRAPGKVTPTINFTLDSHSNRVATVSATAVINTYFIRVVPRTLSTTWSTLTVGDTATASRSKIVMTLVLDTSDSMAPDCGSCPYCTEGGTFLPDAVTQFINVFDDNVDRAAVVSFGTLVKVNLAMSQPFKSSVINVANGLKVASSYRGYTFSPGGLTNALVLNAAVNDPNAVKVVVFFTDGQPNAFMGNLSNNNAHRPCNTGSSNAWIVAGFDSTSPCQQAPEGLFFFPADVDPNNQLDDTCTTLDNPNPCCKGSGQINMFRSFNGSLKAFDETNIVAESTNRCILISNQLRANSNYVYAVGLDVGNIGAPAMDLLQQIANDPKSTTYNPTNFTGVALVAKNGADLTQVFQQIASDILLRLTQ
jgi:Flp pilus assembly protein TadG